MTTDISTAAKLAALHRLNARVKSALDIVKAEWAQGSRPGQRDVAVLGDLDIGTVTMTKPRESFELKDEQAAVAWAREHAPHLIVERIRQADLDALRRKPIDPATGELIPGFEPKTGSPYPKVTPAADADAVIAEALRSGELSFEDVLAIEADGAEQ